MRPDPNDLEGALHFGPILLVAGDADGYRRLCAGFLASRDELTSDVPGRRDYFLARLCLLAPDAVADRDEPSSLAEQAVKDAPTAYHLHVLGLARYRAGRMDEAVAELEKSMAGWPGWPGQPLNHLLLAMARHRPDGPDEARQSLEKAIAATDLHRPGGAGSQMHPHDWVACLLLRQEAEGLIGGAADAPGAAGGQPGVPPGQGPLNE